MRASPPVRIATTPATIAVAIALLAASLSLVAARGAELVYAKDGSGTCGYKDTPILPWCGFHVHDPDRPVPPRIAPPEPAPGVGCYPPPGDAIVLFNGRDLAKWLPNDYVVRDGYAEAAGGGSLSTTQDFGNIQLHLEWMTPDPPQGEMFNRGNNGLMLMGLYEIQIFDSYNEKLYPDGQAASIYGQTPPRVNVCRPPGQWQTYDLVFTAPVFDHDRLIRPARVTLLHNGVLVHLDEEVRGETGHRILPEYKQKLMRGPIVLSGHHNPVRFRNIWVRPL
jgi:hypothetical protein